MKISTKNTLLFAFFAILASNQPLKAIAQPKAVIIVFADALESDRMSMTSKLGWFNSIWNLSSALKAQDNMFKALYNKFGRQSGPFKAYDPQTHEELPLPFAEWLLGENSANVLKKIKAGLSNYKFPNGDKDRDFIFKVLDIIFDPTKMAETFGIKGDMIKLAERIASGPAHPRLILVANSNNVTFDKIRETATGKKAFKPFNNLYVSGKEKLFVEDPELYRKILTYHNLQAADCVIISSNKHAINAAKSVGMHTVYSADNIYSVGKDYCKSTNLIKK